MTPRKKNLEKTTKVTTKKTTATTNKPVSGANKNFPKAPSWVQHMANYAEKNPAVMLVGGIAVLLGLMLLIG